VKTDGKVYDPAALAGTLIMENRLMTIAKVRIMLGILFFILDTSLLV